MFPHIPSALDKIDPLQIIEALVAIPSSATSKSNAELEKEENSRKSPKRRSRKNENENEEIIIGSPYATGASSSYRTMFFGTANIEEQNIMIAEMMETGRLQQKNSNNISNDGKPQNVEYIQAGQNQFSTSIHHPNHPRYKSRYAIAPRVILKPPPNQQSHENTREVFADSPRQKLIEEATSYRLLTKNKNTRPSTSNNSCHHLNDDENPVAILLHHPSPPSSSTFSSRPRTTNAEFVVDRYSAYRIRSNNNNNTSSSENQQSNSLTCEESKVDSFMPPGEPRSAVPRLTSQGTVKYWPKLPEPTTPNFCEIVPPRTFIITEQTIRAAALKARKEEMLLNSQSKNKARRFELPKGIEDAAQRALNIAKKHFKEEMVTKIHLEETKMREIAERKRKVERIRKEKKLRAMLGLV